MDTLKDERREPDLEGGGGGQGVKKKLTLHW